MTVVANLAFQVKPRRSKRAISLARTTGTSSEFADCCDVEPKSILVKSKDTALCSLVVPSASVPMRQLRLCRDIVQRLYQSDRMLRLFILLLYPVARILEAR